MVQVCFVYVRVTQQQSVRILPLNSTHIVFEASNLTSTFVLMLIIIILSFIDWQQGWGVFGTWEDEHVCMHSFSAINLTHLWSFKLDQYICVDANHNLEFRWLATWLRCVLYMWRWAFHMYSKEYTFHRFLALNSTHIIFEALNLINTFNCVDANNHNLEFRWLATWLRCVLYMWGWAFHMYGKVHIS